MSHVTDFILITALYDGASNCDTMEGHNAKYYSNLTGIDFKYISDYTGGNKAIQCDIFMSAMNYYDIDVALEYLNKIKWENPECVQLMVKDEHEDVFKIYTPEVVDAE